MKRSSFGMILAACAALDAVIYVGIVAYLNKVNDEVNPWVIGLLVLGLMIMASLGMLGLLFVSTIPEDMEKEDDQ